MRLRNAFCVLLGLFTLLPGLAQAYNSHGHIQDGADQERQKFVDQIKKDVTQYGTPELQKFFATVQPVTMRSGGFVPLGTALFPESATILVVLLDGESLRKGSNEDRMDDPALIGGYLGDIVPGSNRKIIYFPANFPFSASFGGMLRVQVVYMAYLDSKASGEEMNKVFANTKTDHRQQVLLSTIDLIQANLMKNPDYAKTLNELAKKLKADRVKAGKQAGDFFPATPPYNSAWDAAFGGVAVSDDEKSIRATHLFLGVLLKDFELFAPTEKNDQTSALVRRLKFLAKLFQG
jgi:hypothetical protein